MRRLTTHLSRPQPCWTKCSCPLVLALLLPVSGIAHAGQEEFELADIVRASMARGASYHAPSSEQLRRIEALFLAMISSDDNKSNLRRQFQGFGYRLVFTRDGAGRELRIAYEMENRREGRGVYAVRSDATIPLVVQAPHSFFDRHTDSICARAFQEGDFFAAAWNTSHRSQVDVAHEPRHFFQAFTSAVAEARHGVTVLQIHGFDASQRRTEEGRSASIIVSNGTRLPHLETRRLAHALQAAFPNSRVCLFPWTVHELGATTNVQAARLRSSPDDDFVSLELDQPTRQQLRKDSDQITEFTKALTATIRNK